MMCSDGGNIPIVDCELVQIVIARPRPLLYVEDNALPGRYTAIQEQLGLKLESMKAAAD